MPGTPFSRKRTLEPAPSDFTAPTASIIASMSFHAILESVGSAKTALSVFRCLLFKVYYSIKNSITMVIAY
ncbi:MAG: hypothetical protein ACYC2E_03515, partial [Sulfuricella sp.]